MTDIKNPDTPIESPAIRPKRSIDQDIIKKFMENITKYISTNNLNIQDLVYYNAIWNNTCYTQSKVVSDNNWWEVAQNGWNNTVAFITKYLNLSITDVLSGKYSSITSYSRTTYTADSYTAVDYKVYSTRRDLDSNVLNHLITIQFTNTVNNVIYVTFQHFHNGLNLFTITDKNTYNSVDPTYIRITNSCNTDITLTAVLFQALAWSASVNKIFHSKYQSGKFPASPSGFTDTLAQYVDVNNTLVNCISVSALLKKASVQRKNNKKDIKILLQYIMDPENKLIPKFIDYLIKNGFYMNELLDNFEENTFIVKSRYLEYVQKIKDDNAKKAAEAKALEKA